MVGKRKRVGGFSGNKKNIAISDFDNAVKLIKCLQEISANCFLNNRPFKLYSDTTMNTLCSMFGKARGKQNHGIFIEMIRHQRKNSPLFEVMINNIISPSERSIARRTATLQKRRQQEQDMAIARALAARLEAEMVEKNRQAEERAAQRSVVERNVAANAILEAADIEFDHEFVPEPEIEREEEVVEARSTPKRTRSGRIRSEKPRSNRTYKDPAGYTRFPPGFLKNH